MVQAQVTGHAPSHVQPLAYRLHTLLLPDFCSQTWADVHGEEKTIQSPLCSNGLQPVPHHRILSVHQKSM